jgi:MFS family permease
MQIARIASSMVSVALVLYTLSTYDSAPLTGLTAFFSVFPGLLVSPIAGALLDRHGRTRLVVLDYVVALAALTLIGVLSLLGALPVWLLIVIAAVASLTGPLSVTGLRSLFPLIVPPRLWERANAIDSIGFVLATIVGPPLAAFIVSLWGGAVGFIAIGLTFGVAAIIIAGFPDPSTETVSTGRLLGDAWEGLSYTWRNPTLRGLGFSISALNLAGGVYTVVVPLIVLKQLRMEKTVVGLMFAVQGVAGTLSALSVGRLDTLNRERKMLVGSMVGTGVAVALLLVESNLRALILVMALTGLLNGPLDIALFTLRQRRTDRSWTGRAFAVSMAFNATGLPIGAAIAGAVAAYSIEGAVAFGVATCLASGLLASILIPSGE